MKHSIADELRMSLARADSVEALARTEMRILVEFGVGLHGTAEARRLRAVLRELRSMLASETADSDHRTLGMKERT